MKTRYITSLPLFSYKLIIRDGEGKLNHATLTGEDTKESHKNVASVISDTIGFDRLDSITKKPLGEDMRGERKETEMDINYLRGLLY